MTDPIKFRPGTVVATIGALQAATPAQIAALLKRHLAGDWGDLTPEDKKANENALKWQDRILSSYKTESGEKLWVITEASRESTTILTPGEY